MTTYQSITAQIAKLQAQAEALKLAEKTGVISRIREAIDAYAITAQDLGFGRKGGQPTATRSTKAASGVGVAKYRDPKSGKTWTGRGKPPTWIAGAKDRDVFLIGNGSEAAASTPVRGQRKSKAKASNVGVPKYKDPASDKTWTGRGKPPDWIKGAENRDAFLIAK